MLQKIIKNKSFIYEKIPMVFLILCAVFSFYKVFYIASFPILRHSEWEMLKIFSSETSAFPMTKQGWPIVPELVTRLFYFLGGWNLRAYFVFNYLIYTVDIILLYSLIVNATGTYRCLPLFFIPFFSDLNALSLLQASALQVHLTLLFGLIAVKIAYQSKLTYRNIWFLLVSLILSVLSMNIVFAGVIFLSWSILQVIRGNGKLIAGMLLLIIVFLFVLSVGLNGRFWVVWDFEIDKVFMTLSALLTGFDITSRILFLFVFPIMIGMIWGIYENKLWRDASTVMLCSIVLALILSSFSLFAVSAPLPFSFINSGAGFLVFSVPIVFSLLRLVKPVFIYACCLVVLGYSAGFSSKTFQNESLLRQTTVQCARQYIEQGTQEEACSVIDNKYLPAALEKAKKLKLSFIEPLI